MEKILIRQDANAIEKAINESEKVRQVVQSFIDEVRTIVSFSITDDVFNDLILSNCELTQSKIVQSISSELTKAGITSRFIHTSSIEESVKSFQEAKTKYDKACLVLNISNFSMYLPYMEYNNSTIFFKPIFEQEITERFSVYVTTQKGKELKESHEALVNSLNDFLSHLPKLKQEINLTLFSSSLGKIVDADQSGNYTTSNIDYDFYYAVNQASDVKEFEKLRKQAYAYTNPQ